MKVFVRKSHLSNLLCQKAGQLCFSIRLKDEEEDRTRLLNGFMYTEQHDEIDILVEEMNELLRVQDFWTSIYKRKSKSKI